MKSIFVLGLIALATATRERLVFQDDFNTLDFSKWKHELTMSGGGNWEFELYFNNRSTSYTKDGVLYIKPGLTADYFGINGENHVKSGTTIDMWGGTLADMCTGNNFYGCSRTSGGGGNYINPITSAKLRTAETFNFKYGRVEVKAKMPRGDWLWPAIWMLPRHNEYGNWPASGEIDICESRGNAASYSAGGVNQFGSTLHWGPAYDEDPYEKTHQVYTHTADLDQDFHVYGLYWDENVMYTYFDTPSNKVLDFPINQDFWTLGKFPKPYENPWRASGKNAPFDKDYYIILNLAVGGVAGYFPDGVGGKPWGDHSSNAVNSFYNAKGAWYPTWNGEDAALRIDSVKVWQFD